MTTTGHLRKMVTSLESPIQYRLPLDDELILLNDYVGESISIQHHGEIHCVNCGNRTNKSFSQGHCYPCFMSLASCDMCILKPETCHYHAGTCREPEWGEAHCLQHHYVYLANSSGIKVGITRGTQIPTRWIDQGATQALPVFRVSSRLLSGQIEVALKAHVADKTDWRKMLKSEAEPVDLIARRDELLQSIEKELKAIEKKLGKEEVELLSDEKMVELQFPVNQYPEKVKSLNLDKTPEIEGVLNGIKGQYLILDTGVINIRKYAGYHVSFN